MLVVLITMKLKLQKMMTYQIKNMLMMQLQQVSQTITIPKIAKEVIPF